MKHTNIWVSFLVVIALGLVACEKGGDQATSETPQATEEQVTVDEAAAEVASPSGEGEPGQELQEAAAEDTVQVQEAQEVQEVQEQQGQEEQQLEQGQ